MRIIRAGLIRDCADMSKTSHIALMQVMQLPDAPASDVPDWINLLPAGGVIYTDDGRGPYRVDDAKALAESFTGPKLPVDENHAIDIAAGRGEPSPARGHIVELQAREDGSIWGRTEWNASGRALLADKAYLGISPVITHDPEFRITGILRASLTNRPNLRGMAALHHQEHGMIPDAITKALGLASGASEADVVAAIGQKTKGATDVVALQSSLTEIGKALGAKADATPEAVLTAAKLMAEKEGTLVPALQAQISSLEASVKALKETGARKAAEVFVDAAKASGRTAITQDNREKFIALHMADPAGTEALINGMPQMKGVGTQIALQQSGAEVALQSDSRDLTARAKAYQASQKAAGNDIGWADAVYAVSEGKK